MLLAVSLLSLYRRRALASGGALVPGRYTASVVALQDNQPVGRVSRVFEITAAVK